MKTTLLTNVLSTLSPYPHYIIDKECTMHNSPHSLAADHKLTP